MRLCKMARFCAFCAFLLYFVCVSALFSYQNGAARKRNLSRILQKCAKSAFMQYPFSYTPVCMSPNYMAARQ